MEYYVHYTYNSLPKCSFPTPIGDMKWIEASSRLEAVDILREKFKDWHKKGCELMDVDCVLTREEKEKRYVPVSPRLSTLLDLSTREHIKTIKKYLNDSSFTLFNTEDTINAIRNDYIELNRFRRSIGCDEM